MRLTRVFLALAALLPAFAETHTLDKEKAAVLLDAAAKEGVEIPAKTTVRDSVGVTAVLLTQSAVRRLFGREIANVYAVVQLTISNRSADAGFILHSAYIDTSQWALGGGTRGYRVTEEEPARAGSKPNRISSVEARIVRGQLLDAQQWSARNWVVRLLTVTGSLAAGYSFAFKEAGIAKGIAAFNGAVVPGVAFAWPDGAVAQQNRISDFGYQTNKIIGKQSSDIIVCFFPIDMFLSAPFREVFLKAPGLFLSPYQILFTEANKRIREELGIAPDIEGLRRLHPCYSKVFEAQRSKAEPPSALGLLQESQKSIEDGCKQELTEEKNRKMLIELDYIGRFGLQNIGVYVDGVMTVDIDIVPASIDQAVFDGDASKSALWDAPGEKTGVLQCRFCAGGQVSILEAGKLGITDVATIADGSNDRTLKFSFKTTKAIEPGQSLTFVVTKKPADPKKSSQEVKSAPFVYTVSYVAEAPSITKVAVEGKKVTVAGSGFFNTKANPLSVSLHSGGTEVSVTPAEGPPTDKLTFDIPNGLAPGCWGVRVKLGSMEASAPGNAEILSAATPKLTGATRGADSITVKGEQLVDTSGCGGKALKFQLQTAPPAKPAEVTYKLGSPSGATLSLPTEARNGAWTVHLLQGTDDVSSTELK